MSNPSAVRSSHSRGSYPLLTVLRMAIATANPKNGNTTTYIADEFWQEPSIKNLGGDA